MKQTVKTAMIFAHGFGFDNFYWTQLIKKLSPLINQVDILFLDAKTDSAKLNKKLMHLNYECILGIGHSQGVQKLLASQIQFNALISFNGFIDFFGQGTPLEKKRRLEHRMMCKSFRLDPIKALKQFYKRCDITFNTTTDGLTNLYDNRSLQQDKLLQALDDLTQIHCIDLNYPILNITSEQDPVVPLNINQISFGETADCENFILNTSGHNLGFKYIHLYLSVCSDFLQKQIQLSKHSSKISNKINERSNEY